ncbi:Cyclin-U1-1 [Platanthera zijinensis]|uniref:Cyclin n=1 Tax=Platanthera zijinensis TaxID=2320716 RepID=A0AAP0BXQ0_9ASPA
MGGGSRWTPGGAELDAQQAVASVANALEKLVARNDGLGVAVTVGEEERKGRGLTAFVGPRRPGISIKKYLERIHSYVLCSPASLVAGFVYVDRAAHRSPELLVGSLNVHRLILTGVMVASKFFDVMPQSNAFYAKVGGVSNDELNKLELELLFLLDFRINMSSHEFESYLSHLEKEMTVSLNSKITTNIQGVGDNFIAQSKVHNIHWK